MKRNKIDPNANANLVSINTPVPQTIVAADFDKYLDEINSTFFDSQEVFTYITLVDAGTNTATVVVELVNRDGVANQTLTMRIGETNFCRGKRIMTGTDATAVLNVGAGN